MHDGQRRKARTALFRASYPKQTNKQTVMMGQEEDWAVCIHMDEYAAVRSLRFLVR